MNLIEVVGEDMQCFKVRADNLEPLSASSYYEPAAWRDPQGRQQMSLGEWLRRRADRRDADMRVLRYSRDESQCQAYRERLGL